MLKIILSVIVIVLAVMMIACSGEKEAETKMDMEPKAKTAMVDDDSKATCPSCNMVMDKSEMITHVAEGDTLYFCAEGCKKHYLAQQETKTE